MMKFDRRRTYYLVLDCETATLPCVRDLPEDQRHDVSIAKPLIYDLGWTIVDKHGKIWARENFLISEVFSVPEIFNTAYYRDKRPIYLDLLKKGEIQLTDWRTATNLLMEYMKNVVCSVGAYNAMFDFKKALPFTELYINQLYGPDVNKWLDYQAKICKDIASGHIRPSRRDFEKDIFRFRGEEFPLFDVWGMACRHLLNNDNYRNMCLAEGWQTPSGKYFKTSAETAYRFVTGRQDFDEAHTALNDAEIESLLFAEAVKKNRGKVDMGIEFFPFKLVGLATL